MTLQELTKLLTPLGVAMRADLDGPTFRAYHGFLQNVPLHLVAAGLEQLKASGLLRFFPSAAEIQAAAEQARRQQLALHAWEACCECEDAPGWRKVTDRDGVHRMEKCPCVRRFRERLASYGLLEPVATLPGEAAIVVNEPRYPSTAQLPAPMRRELQSVADRKRMP